LYLGIFKSLESLHISSMYKPLSDHLPHEIGAHTRAIIEHQVIWEMPVALMATAISHGGVFYNENQIRTFAKILATTVCEYRINRTDVHHPTYRELWEQTSAIDEEWQRFRRLFGDDETNKMIDRAVEQQNRRERGEVE